MVGRSERRMLRRQMNAMPASIPFSRHSRYVRSEQTLNLATFLSLHPVDCYTVGKTEFIVGILGRQGMSADALEGISAANKGFIERSRARGAAKSDS